MTVATTFMNRKVVKLSISSTEDPYLRYGFTEELKVAIHTINKNKSLHTVIVSGTDDYFSAGASQDALLSTEIEHLPHYVADVPRLLLSINVPTIAIMKGHAIGGGLALGLWCDHCFLSEESLYGANFMTLWFHTWHGLYTRTRAFFW